MALYRGNVCCVYLNPHPRGDSNEYTQHYLILYKINCSASSRKHIYRGISVALYRGTVCCVYLLNPHPRGDSNEYTQHYLILYKIEDIPYYYPHRFPGQVL